MRSHQVKVYKLLTLDGMVKQQNWEITKPTGITVFVFGCMKWVFLFILISIPITHIGCWVNQVFITVISYTVNWGKVIYSINGIMIAFFEKY